MSQTNNQPNPTTVREAIDQQLWEYVPNLVEKTLKQTDPSRHAITLSRIAYMHNHAQRPHDAVDYFLKAIDVSQNTDETMQIHGWVASTLAEINRYEEAKVHADKSLYLRDKLSNPHKKHKKMVAFSLYGKQPAYCEMAVLNAKAMPEIYPNWQMRVYHDDSVPNHVVARLKSLGAECVNVADIQAAHMPGTFWRFLALEDWDYDVVLMRDADSLIGFREKILVEEWLESAYPFHVIRDWYGHTDLMLAGLWGARGGFLGDIRARIDAYLRDTQNVHPTHADQFFLAEHVWQRIKPYCLHHSSVIDFDGAVWSEKLPRVNYHEKGHVFQLGSWRLSTYTPHSTLPFTMYLAEVQPDQSERVFCDYEFEAGEVFELPRAYREAIDEGKMKLYLVPKKQAA